MARKTHKKPTYKNFNSMPTKHIEAILNSPHCTGQDGQDYEPYKHELEAVLWSRAQKEHDEFMASYERDQKEYLKHIKAEEKARRQKAKEPTQCGYCRTTNPMECGPKCF